MIYKTLTACAFVCVAYGAQAQSLEELFGGLKPKQIERSIQRHIKHSGNMVKTTWYGPGFHGRKTASGARFNSNGMTVAHRYHAFGTRVQFTNPKNGKSVVVRVTDRGPFRKGYSYDLAKGAARAIGMTGTATLYAKVLN